MEQYTQKDLDEATQRALDAEACYKASKLALKFIDNHVEAARLAKCEARMRLPEYKAHQDARDASMSLSLHVDRWHRAWLSYSERAEYIRGKLK